jgi:hypothetical protein
MYLVQGIRSATPHSLFNEFVNPDFLLSPCSRLLFKAAKYRVRKLKCCKIYFISTMIFFVCGHRKSKHRFEPSLALYTH